VNYAKKLPLLPEKSFQDNEFDNKENVKRLLNCVINVLIYWVTNRILILFWKRMAQNPEKVLSFLNDLLKSETSCSKEFLQLTAFAKEQTELEQLEKWDGAYYSEIETKIIQL
jgi:peptidyl-dipeptidase Dcp